VGSSEELVAFAHDDAELLSRTRDRIAGLRATGRSISLAVLACSAESGQAVRGRRTEVARLLLSALKDGGFGRLVLSARDSASQSLREELLSLAGDLTAVVQGSQLTISLRFAPPASLSRSFPVTPLRRRAEGSPRDRAHKGAA